MECKYSETIERGAGSSERADRSESSLLSEAYSNYEQFNRNIERESYDFKWIFSIDDA